MIAKVDQRPNPKSQSRASETGPSVRRNPAYAGMASPRPARTNSFLPNRSEREAPASLSPDPGEEHGRGDQVRGDEVDASKDEVCRQEPEHGEEGPCTDHGGGREECERAGPVLGGVGGRSCLRASHLQGGAPEEGGDQYGGERDQGQAHEAEPPEHEPREEGAEREPEVAADHEVRDGPAPFALGGESADGRERDRVEGRVHDAGDGREQDQGRERGGQAEEADRDTADEHGQRERHGPSLRVGEPAEDRLDEGRCRVVRGQEEAREKVRESALADEDRDDGRDHGRIDVDPEVTEREPEDLPRDPPHATRLRMRTHSTGISTVAFRWWAMDRGRTSRAETVSSTSPRPAMSLSRNGSVPALKRL